jgi:hypothetical protein
MKRVAVILGSDSDLPVVRPAIETLKEYDVPCEAHVMSAHRTPEAVQAFASKARDNGLQGRRHRPQRQKAGTIAGKGVINNKVTNYLMQMLEKARACPPTSWRSSPTGTRW